MSAVGGGRGSPKSRQEEHNQLICDSDKGGRGQKSENVADVICGSPRPVRERVRKREMKWVKWSAGGRCKCRILWTWRRNMTGASIKKPESTLPFLLPSHWCFISSRNVVLSFCLSGINVLCCLLYVMYFRQWLSCPSSFRHLFCCYGSQNAFFQVREREREREREWMGDGVNTLFPTELQEHFFLMRDWHDG